MCILSNSLDCTVQPLQCESKHLCAIRVRSTPMEFLLYSLYMPCDTGNDLCNRSEFNEVLRKMVLQTVSTLLCSYVRVISILTSDGHHLDTPQHFQILLDMSALYYWILCLASMYNTLLITKVIIAGLLLAMFEISKNLRFSNLLMLSLI